MNTLAVWILVSLFLKTSFSLVCPSQKDAKVLIFGAGAAGVTAARILHDSGVTNIKILEAHNKIGGRIRSKTFSGVQIEVGANWIHEAPREGSGMNAAAEGNNVNPIWTLARGEFCPVEGKLSGIYTDEAKFMDEVNDQYQEVANTATEIERTYMGKYKKALQTAGACSTVIGRTVRTGLNEQKWNPDTTLKELVEWSDFDFTYGTTPDKSNLYFTAENHNVEFGKHCYIVTDQQSLGFASILKCLAKPFESTISLNKEVDSIDWNNECVCAQVAGQGRMCADYGIVTFSIGVLQNWLNSNPSRFVGSLSSEKMKAITNSKMGLYLKIFVKFPDAFWETDSHYIYFTNQKRGYYPVIQPIGAALPGKPPIMLMTVTGDEAKRLSALTKDQNHQIKNEILTVLRERYGTGNVPDISVDDIEYHDWYKDEFFRGMFSNNPTTLQQNDKINLAEPEGRLYFSGEANSIEHGGTIHGAYCSGIDTATKILKEKKMTENIAIPKCTVQSSSGNRKRSTREIAKRTCPPSDPSSAINIRVSLLLTLLSTLMVFSALMIFSV